MLLLLNMERKSPMVLLSSEVVTWCIYEDFVLKGKQKIEVHVTI